MRTFDKNEVGRRRGKIPSPAVFPPCLAYLTGSEAMGDNSVIQDQLGIFRVKEGRLFAEMREQTQRAFENAWHYSVHKTWLSRVVKLVTIAPPTPALYDNEARQLVCALKRDPAKLYRQEEEDVRLVAAKLRDYARALGALACGEFEAMRQKRPALQVSANISSCHTVRIVSE